MNETYLGIFVVYKTKLINRGRSSNGNPKNCGQLQISAHKLCYTKIHIA